MEFVLFRNHWMEIHVSICKCIAEYFKYVSSTFPAALGWCCSINMSGKCVSAWLIKWSVGLISLKRKNGKMHLPFWIKIGSSRCIVWWMAKSCAILIDIIFYYYNLGKYKTKTYLLSIFMEKKYIDTKFSSLFKRTCVWQKRFISHKFEAF